MFIKMEDAVISVIDNVSHILIQLEAERDIQKYMLYVYWRDHNDISLPILAMSSTLVHTRMPDYYEDWLPNYLERDFFNLFRVTKDTLLHLLAAINCPDRLFTGGQSPVSTEKCTLMLLWWLGKGDTLLSVSDRFNVSTSTVFNAIEFLLPKILQLQSKYISWPSSNEAEIIEREFKEKCSYPGVIGAIDGCNIHFKCALGQQESYIDKNRNHSIKLQGIATTKRIFTNIMVGFPGSAHDSRVLQNSQIWTDIEENGRSTKYFFKDFHLVGDKAYPLKKWLMTPYKDDRLLDASQRYHNYAHSKTRVVVEQTFGILKSRWRILKMINVNCIEKAIKIIAACCILHNFCYVHSDEWNEFEDMTDMTYHGAQGYIEAEADTKRSNITNILWRDHIS